MKNILLLISLFTSVLAFGQATDNTIDKGTGILYFSGVPGTVPDTTNFGSEMAIDVRNKQFYFFNRDSSKWKIVSGIQQGFGTPTAYVSGQEKTYLDLVTGKIYYYNSSVWVELGSGGGSFDDTELRDSLGDHRTEINANAASIAVDNDQNATNEIQSILRTGQNVGLNLGGGSILDSMGIHRVDFVQDSILRFYDQFGNLVKEAVIEISRGGGGAGSCDGQDSIYVQKQGRKTIFFQKDRNCNIIPVDTFIQEINLFESPNGYTQGEAFWYSSDSIEFEKITIPALYNNSNNDKSWNGVVIVGEKAFMIPEYTRHFATMDLASMQFETKFTMANLSGEKHNQGGIWNGRHIVSVPHREDYIYLFDSEFNFIDTIAHGQNGLAFTGAATDGEVTLFAPNQSDSIMIMDNSTLELSFYSKFAGQDKYSGVVYANDRFYLINRETDSFTEFDRIRDTCIIHPSPFNSLSGNYFTGGAVDDFGKIWLAGANDVQDNVNAIYYFDTYSNVFDSISYNFRFSTVEVGQTKQALAGVCRDKFDNIWMSPSSTLDLLKINPNTGEIKSYPTGENSRTTYRSIFAYKDYLYLIGNGSDNIIKMKIPESAGGGQAINGNLSISGSLYVDGVEVSGSGGDDDWTEVGTTLQSGQTQVGIGVAPNVTGYTVPTLTIGNDAGSFVNFEMVSSRTGNGQGTTLWSTVNDDGTGQRQLSRFSTKLENVNAGTRNSSSWLLEFSDGSSTFSAGAMKDILQVKPDGTFLFNDLSENYRIWHRGSDSTTFLRHHANVVGDFKVDVLPNDISRHAVVADDSGNFGLVENSIIFDRFAGRSVLGVNGSLIVSTDVSENDEDVNGLKVQSNTEAAYLHIKTNSAHQRGVIWGDNSDINLHDYLVLSNGDAQIRHDNVVAYTIDDDSVDYSFDVNVPNATVTGELLRGGNVKWVVGNGSPEGVVTAAVGSIYTRTDGGALTVLYVKESGVGNTGWVAK